MLGIDRDISERKEAEEALRAAEAKYRTLVEQIPAVIYTAAIDERSSTSYVSPQIESILGFAPDEWLADYPTEPWTQIKGIGNRIRHEYFRLDDAILWQVITQDSHALKSAMQSMLDRHDPKSGQMSPSRP